MIKNLRIKNKLTQTQLAQRLGLQLSTLQKYENGSIQNIKMETLKNLCVVFNVPPIVFLFPNIDANEQHRVLEWAIFNYSGLNAAGANKVIEYVIDLRENPKYRK